MCQSKVGKRNALDKLCKSDLNLSFGPRSAGQLKGGLKIHPQQTTLVKQAYGPRNKINMLKVYEKRIKETQHFRLNYQFLVNKQY